MIKSIKHLWNYPLVTYTYYRTNGYWVSVLKWKLSGIKGLGLLVEKDGLRIMLWWWHVFISTKSIK